LPRKPIPLLREPDETDSNHIRNACVGFVERSNEDVHFRTKFFPYGVNFTGLFVKRSLCGPLRLPEPLKSSFQCAGQSIPIDPAIFAAEIHTDKSIAARCVSPYPGAVESRRFFARE
jgi:hypothetical protein